MKTVLFVSLLALFGCRDEDEVSPLAQTVIGHYRLVDVDLILGGQPVDSGAVSALSGEMSIDDGLISWESSVTLTVTPFQIDESFVSDQTTSGLDDGTPRTGFLETFDDMGVSIEIYSFEMQGKYLLAVVHGPPTDQRTYYWAKNGDHPEIP